MAPQAPPSFTPEQEAFIEKIVFKVYDVIEKRHVETCPWGKKLMRAAWVGFGIGLTLGLLGVSNIPQLIHWFRTGTLP